MNVHSYSKAQKQCIVPKTIDDGEDTFIAHKCTHKQTAEPKYNRIYNKTNGNGTTTREKNIVFIGVCYKSVLLFVKSRLRICFVLFFFNFFSFFFVSVDDYEWMNGCA